MKLCKVHLLGSSDTGSLPESVNAYQRAYQISMASEPFSCIDMGFSFVLLLIGPIGCDLMKQELCGLFFS